MLVRAGGEGGAAPDEDGLGLDPARVTLLRLGGGDRGAFPRHVDRPLSETASVGAALAGDDADAVAPVAAYLAPLGAARQALDRCVVVLQVRSCGPPGSATGGGEIPHIQAH